MHPLFHSMLDAAAAAFSPQNSQAWRFRINGDRLYAGLDTSRLFPTVDPHHRMGWVSLGAAVENARLTAMASGANPAIRFTGSSEWPVEIQLVAGYPPPSADMALAGQIPHRRTYRGRMRGPALPSRDLFAASRAALPGAHLIELSPSARVALLDIVEWAMGKELSDSQARRELHRWLRIWPWQSRAATDGLPLESLALTGIRRKIAPLALLRPFDGMFSMPAKMARQARAITDTSPNVFLFAAETDDPAGWFEGGRGWERAALALTRAGVATHAILAPLNVPKAAAAIRRVFGRAPTEGLIVLARAGHAPTALVPTPARSPEDLLS